MVQVIRQTDIAEMLAAFERSGFERFLLHVGSTRVAAGRNAPAACEEMVTIVAPHLGTFQAGREAGAAPLVRPGDRIEDETVIGMIRVRRTVIAVQAGRRGTAEAMLVSDGDFVEYGQALLEVRPDAGAASGAAR